MHDVMVGRCGFVVGKSELREKNVKDRLRIVFIKLFTTIVSECQKSKSNGSQCFQQVFNDVKRDRDLRAIILAHKKRGHRCHVG
jgi:hypothetical protein